MVNVFCTVCDKHRKFKNPKISYIQKQYQVFLLFLVSVVTNIKKYLKKKD